MAPSPQELRLAVGFSSDLVLRRALFVLAVPALLLLPTLLGRAPVLQDYFIRVAYWTPLAAAFGALLSALDYRQTREHSAAYADVEIARRAASRSCSFRVLREYSRAGRRHRRVLRLHSLAPLIVVLLFGAVGGFAGGMLLLGVTFGTEFIFWHLVWRGRLLASAAHLETRPGSEFWEDRQ